MVKALGGLEAAQAVKLGATAFKTASVAASELLARVEAIVKWAMRPGKAIEQFLRQLEARDTDHPNNLLLRDSDMMPRHVVIPLMPETELSHSLFMKAPTAVP